MGVVKLKKAELYYHKSIRDGVASALQENGACQIIEEAQDTRNADIEAKLAECEEQRALLRYLFRSLGPYFADPVSSIDRMLGNKPAFSFAELTRLAGLTDLAKTAAVVRDLEAELNELRVEVSQHKADEVILTKLADFPYSLDVVGDGTRTLKGVVGTLAEERLEPLREDLRPLAADTELFTARGPKDKEAWNVLMYARAREEEVLDIAVRSGMVFIELPAHIRGTVAEESGKIAARLAECEKKEAGILEDMKKIAAEKMPDVQRLSDYWNSMADRWLAMKASENTEYTQKTRFWIPEDSLPDLEKRIEAVSPDTALEVSDPEEGDNPPTLLKNNAFAGPAEMLTGLYSPPIYGHRDPTGPMAPFFFLFFGMCLGDAGYALVMAGVLLMLFRKYRKIPSDVKTFMRLILSGAVATFLYGLFTGSFFGDFIDKFPFVASLRPLKDTLLIVDPMKNPMAVLGLSLLLGIIHLMFGLAIAAYDEIRAGNIIDAVGGKISWIFFVVGLVVGMIASGGLRSAGLLAAAVGTCLIFWYAGRGTKNIFLKIGSGLYALYGSTAYLGDILSYSRLLALGLGSAVIGSVINMFGVMIADVPYIGWTLAVVIVIGGHVFSLLINLLGAFVHAMRLQFVEFFGKFYLGDGRPFKPLRFQTQYVEVFDKN
jgi:V/A-type H+-transporting ATPase subunit I